MYVLQRMRDCTVCHFTPMTRMRGLELTVRWDPVGSLQSSASVPTWEQMILDARGSVCAATAVETELGF